MSKSSGTRMRGRRESAFNGHVLREDTLTDGRGNHVPLRPRSMAVLRCLAAHAGEVVAKEALLDEVWPDVTVTEDSLTQCIRDIRRAIGDDEKRVLETVPRVGFRLNPDRGPRLARHAPSLLAAAVLASLVPLVTGWPPPPDRGDMPGFAITAEPAMTTLAAEVGGAVDRYRSLRRMTGEARFELRLSGRPEAGVVAELIDHDTRRVIFSQSYGVGEGADDTLPARLAARIASPLGGEIPRVLSDAARRKPADQLSPTECYLLNYQLQGNQNNDDTARRSETCLARLLRDDPGDARALALRGALYAQQYWWGVGLPEPARSDPALRSDLARKALESARASEALFAPPDAATYYAIARAYYANCRTDETITAARRALEINPDDPNILGGTGNWVAYVGNWSEGAALAARAIELAPRGYARWWYWPIAKGAWIEGDYAAALDGFMRAYDENSWLSQVQLAYTLPFLGREAEARRAVARLRRLVPGFTRSNARAAYERWCFPADFISRMDGALSRAGLPDGP